jgi:hypothetical protein
MTDRPRLAEWVTMHEGFEGSSPDSVNAETIYQKLSDVCEDFDAEWTACDVSEPQLRVALRHRPRTRHPL